MSWINAIFNYVKKNIGLIVKALIIFALSNSGLLIAISFRYFGYNGTVIASIGILFEVIALILCFLLLYPNVRESKRKQRENIQKKTLK